MRYTSHGAHNEPRMWWKSERPCPIRRAERSGEQNEPTETGRSSASRQPRPGIGCDPSARGGPLPAVGSGGTRDHDRDPPRGPCHAEARRQSATTGPPTPARLLVHGQGLHGGYRGPRNGRRRRARLRRREDSGRLLQVPQQTRAGRSSRGTEALPAPQGWSARRGSALRPRAGSRKRYAPISRLWCEAPKTQEGRRLHPPAPTERGAYLGPAVPRAPELLCHGALSLSSVPIAACRTVRSEGRAHACGVAGLADAPDQGHRSPGTRGERRGSHRRRRQGGVLSGARARRAGVRPGQRKG
ncbi:MAG: hypothetical protein KatS3mg102_0725 [Planctomycetota bacterium]|nr:MAG: hypothetical protein KatS3mg102_0725 [Planctomycetota bacterium]